MSEKLKKRTWCYVGLPASYDIPGCKCGNNECVYSEYEDRLWCDKCQIDFVPEHWGVFDGPILMEVCELFGMNFDHIDLERDVYQKHIHKDNSIEYEDLTPEQAAERILELEKKHLDFMEQSGFVILRNPDSTSRLTRPENVVESSDEQPERTTVNA